MDFKEGKGRIYWPDQIHSYKEIYKELGKFESRKIIPKQPTPNNTVIEAQISWVSMGIILLGVLLISFFLVLIFGGL